MLNRSLRAPLAALPLAAAVVFTQAQAAALGQLPETIVTAQRFDQPLTDVLADVSIIDSTTIEQSGSTGLADLLARLPGVVLARSGGLMGTTSVYVRGAETRHTSLFVDGIRIDTQGTSGVSWNAIPLAQIDRIEVVRGPAAAVYGSDAIGGVVQIFTKKGQAGVHPSLELGVGRYGTRRLGASISGTEGIIDYAFGLTRDISTGFNSQPAANPDADGHRGTSGSVQLGAKINNQHKLGLSVLSNDIQAQYDGYAAPGAAPKNDISHIVLQALGVNWQAQWTDAYSTKLSVNQSKDHYATTPSVYKTDTTLTNYVLQNELRMGVHRFSATLDSRRDELNNSSVSSPISARSQNGLALGYGAKMDAHTWQLNVRHDQDSEFGSHNTAGAAYAFAFAPNWQATTSASTAFRTPTLYQRFSEYGVATLKPESSRNLEAGVKYAAQGNTVSVVVYRNRVSDLISYIGGPGSCINGVGTYAGCYGNTSQAQYKGATLAAGTRLGTVALGGSIDWLSAIDLSTGKRLPRRPQRMATLNADTQIAGIDMGAQVQTNSERFDNAANTKKLGGYTVLNLQVSKAVTPVLSVVARLDNAADKAYQTASGYANGGRMWYVGMKWTPR
jgi:vitamin B12 transporter